MITLGTNSSRIAARAQARRLVAPLTATARAVLAVLEDAPASVAYLAALLDASDTLVWLAVDDLAARRLVAPCEWGWTLATTAGRRAATTEG